MSEKVDRIIARGVALGMIADDLVGLRVHVVKLDDGTLGPEDRAILWQMCKHLEETAYLLGRLQYSVQGSSGKEESDGGRAD